HGGRVRSTPAFLVGGGSLPDERVACLARAAGIAAADAPHGVLLEARQSGRRRQSAAVTSPASVDGAHLLPHIHGPAAPAIGVRDLHRTPLWLAGGDDLRPPARPRLKS